MRQAWKKDLAQVEGETSSWASQSASSRAVVQELDERRTIGFVCPLTVLEFLCRVIVLSMWSQVCIM